MDYSWASMDTPSSSPGGRIRPSLLFGLPALALLAWLILPLITGAETLILRDVLQVHMLLKVPQVSAMKEGFFPLLDAVRSGGQPLAGNPNAVPFYPDNLLYLVAPLFWAFNAHFWIHLLLAPLAAYWMGRAWGLGRPAAWATGVCYGASGYLFSQLNLYNLVAGAALIPALVGAVLAAGSRRSWAAPAAGLLWALLLVSGDPLSAILGALLAGSAFLVRHGPRPGRRSLALLAAAVGLGTLVALPQIVEFLRILPASDRAIRGFSEWRLTVGAWRPAHLLDWIVPLPFGRIDRLGAGGFWATGLFDGKLPLFLSLYPGLLALGLVAASGRPRDRRSWWAWGAVAVGLFFALGGYNPVAARLFDLPGGGAFRYPVKLWPLVAAGAALLCGIGFERTFGAAIRGEGRPRLRPLALALGLCGLALAAIWLLLVFAPGRFEGAILSLSPPDWTPFLAAAERARWIATVVTCLAILAALAAALALSRTRPMAGACLLLVVHTAGQIVLLKPLVATDTTAFYRQEPPALAAASAGRVVANAEFLDLFGDSPVAVGPDNRPQWRIRQHYLSLAPFAGVLNGLRYELDRSPEGLESYLGRLATAAVEAAPNDTVRLRGLGRWGVDTLVADDPLTGVPPGLARLESRTQGITKPVSVYRLPKAAPELLFAETVLEVPHLNAARDLFFSPGFDPDRHVVMPGPETAPVPSLPSLPLPPATEDTPPNRGSVRMLSSGPEALEVAIDSTVPGVLVVQRALLPVWRGTLDGDPIELEPANLYRIGVRVPAGSHRVRLQVDRRPLVASAVASALGLIGLIGLAFVPRRRPAGGGRRSDLRTEAVQVEGPAEDV